MAQAIDYQYRNGQQIVASPKVPNGWVLTILPSPGIGLDDVEAILMHRVGKWTVRAVADDIKGAVERVLLAYSRKYNPVEV
jgi:hypothetical protein